MCGIVGYVGPRAPVSPERLAVMRDTLAHRGPDDAGLFVDRVGDVEVGLAHRRLAILDTRAVGRQPMSRGGLQVVFNGEIYGFAALRTALMRQGHVFTTRTDTEVLLALYQERGVDMVQELDGMFAFALWDPDEARLLLARDRTGKKPLYLAERGQTLLFASEIKALLASGVVDDALDLQAHHDYLGLNYTPGPRTAFAAIDKLDPGHAAVWESGRLRRFAYHAPKYRGDLSAPPRPPSFEQAALETLAELRGAVRRRLVSDVPLGMFLSGGIDSTAVLMCMAEASAKPVQAFTIRFEEATFDESEHARLAAQAFGAEHHVETVRPTLDTFLGPLTEAFDEPYADSSAIPLWYLARMARQHVTVALAGDGGDEAYAGYRTHVAWRIGERYRALPRLLTERLIPALVERLPVRHTKVSFDLKAKAFVRAASQAPIDAHYGFKAFLSDEARHALIAAPPQASTARLFHAIASAHPHAEALEAILACDVGVYLPDDILVKVDRMTMAHGLEARAPFLDRQVLAHAASLPVDYKLRGLTTKAVLKRALKGRVPERLLTRSKAGFNVPMAQWLCTTLRPLGEALLAPEKVRQVGLWRPEVVTRLWQEHQTKQRDHSRPLWALICFMRFNDRFRGGRAP